MAPVFDGEAIVPPVIQMHFGQRVLHDEHRTYVRIQRCPPVRQGQAHSFQQFHLICTPADSLILNILLIAIVHFEYGFSLSPMGYPQSEQFLHVYSLSNKQVLLKHVVQA